MILRQACPVCGGNHLKKIFERDFSGMKNLVPFVRYDVAKCEDCGMLFAANIEQERSLDEYYAQMSRYENDDYILSEGTRELYGVWASLIAKYSSPTAKVVDIGCAFGGGLGELRKRGYTNLFGVEPSEKNRRYGERTYGIKMSPGYLGGVLGLAV